MDEVLPNSEAVPKESITRFLDDLQHAKDEQARNRARNELWLRGWRLARCYARRAFIGHLDEEDIQDAANIAFEQFAIRAMEGRFAELKNRTNFFTLLATISARASKNIKRSRAAQKRGGEAKFDSSDALRGLSDPSAAEDIARFEDAEEMAAFFLFLRELGEDEELFRIAELVHTGEIDPEDKMALAERVGISRAGVFRKWAKLCAKWAEFEARVSSTVRKPAGEVSCGVIWTTE